MMGFTKCIAGCGKLTCRKDGYCLTCFRKAQEKSTVKEQNIEPKEVIVDNSEIKYRNTFYCFQGKQFVNECSGGYLFALDKSISHWQRLRELKKGDIIFHGTAQCVLAISVVEGRCYKAKRPREHYLANDLKDAEGLIVKTKYDLIDNPICLAADRDVIVEIQGDATGQGYPFNKNGTGNQGYLFNLREGLAKYFFLEIIERNPSFVEKEYAQFLLEGCTY